MVFYELLNCYNKHLAADPGTTTILKQGTAYITPECISHSFMLGCENIQLRSWYPGPLWALHQGRGNRLKQSGSKLDNYIPSFYILSEFSVVQIHHTKSEVITYYLVCTWKWFYFGIWMKGNLIFVFWCFRNLTENGTKDEFSNLTGYVHIKLPLKLSA